MRDMASFRPQSGSSSRSYRFQFHVSGESEDRIVPFKVSNADCFISTEGLCVRTWGLIGSEDEETPDDPGSMKATVLGLFAKALFCLPLLLGFCVPWVLVLICAKSPAKLSRLRPFGGPGPASISSTQ
jgi:hypothetical protein